jgi:hypothetical protein
MGGCRLGLAPNKGDRICRLPRHTSIEGNETSTSTMHRSSENIADGSGIRRPGKPGEPECSE